MGNKNKPKPAATQPAALPALPESSENSQTEVIRVIALRSGYVDHIFRRPGKIFDLRPRLATDGKPVITAREQLSIDRTVPAVDKNGIVQPNKPKRLIRGWMKVLGVVASAAAPRKDALVAQTAAISENLPDGDAAVQPLSGELGSMPDTSLNADPDGADDPDDQL